MGKILVPRQGSSEVEACDLLQPMGSEQLEVGSSFPHCGVCEGHMVEGGGYKKDVA
jgi:hypothetical protein